MQAVRVVGVTLIITGIVVAALSLLADIVGIGSEDGVFGYKQLIGTVLGAAGIIAGVILLFKK
ncbi:MAG: hypothetical protein P8107_13105 [Spirochaetia bacterium]